MSMRYIIPFCFFGSLLCMQIDEDEIDVQRVALIARLSKKQVLPRTIQKTDLAEWPQSILFDNQKNSLAIFGFKYSSLRPLDTYLASFSIALNKDDEEEKEIPEGLAVSLENRRLEIEFNERPIKTINLKQTAQLLGIINASICTLEKHRENGFFYLYFRSLDPLCDLIQKDEQELQELCLEKKEKKTTCCLPFS